jgi:hypothetical protein
VQLAVVAYIAKNDVLYKREFNLIFHMYWFLTRIASKLAEILLCSTLIKIVIVIEIEIEFIIIIIIIIIIIDFSIEFVIASIIKLMPNHHLLRCYSLYFAPFGFYRVLRTYCKIPTKYDANHSSIDSLNC